MGKKQDSRFPLEECGHYILIQRWTMARSVNTIDASSKAGTGSVFTLVHAVFQLADKQLH